MSLLIGTLVARSVGIRSQQEAFLPFTQIVPSTMWPVRSKTNIETRRWSPTFKVRSSFKHFKNLWVRMIRYDTMQKHYFNTFKKTSNNSYHTNTRTNNLSKRKNSALQKLITIVPVMLSKSRAYHAQFPF